MSKLLGTAALAAVLSVSGITVYAVQSHQHEDQTSAKPAKVVSAVCPVMKSKIPDVKKASGKSVYKGKTYYFCCKGCKPMFDKNPEKYLKKAAPKK